MKKKAEAASLFTPAFFNFLRELKRHDNRPWFEKNKARYERDVRHPLVTFVAAAGPKLRKVSPPASLTMKAVIDGATANQFAHSPITLLNQSGIAQTPLVAGTSTPGSKQNLLPLVPTNSS